MKLRINLKLIGLFAGLGIAAIIAMVYAANSYSVGPNQTVTVRPAGGGNDYTVKNKTTKKIYFIPNKTQQEWNAFLTACQGRLSGDLRCTQVASPSCRLVHEGWKTYATKTDCVWNSCDSDVAACLDAHPGCFPGETKRCICQCYCSMGGGVCNPGSYWMSLNQDCCS